MNSQFILRRVLVPVSGGDSDEQAVRLACSLVDKKGTVYLFNVLEVARDLPLDAPPRADVERSDALLEQMERVAQSEKRTVETEAVQAREAGPTVVNEAIERGVDAIVVGVDFSKARGEFELGATVNYVLRRAHCRVWLSRGPAPDELVNGRTPAS